MPSYVFDTANPLDTMLVSQFPANERTFRTAVENWRLLEHANTGRHKLPSGDQTARDALADKLAGMWFWDTAAGLLERFQTGSTWDYSHGLWLPGDMKVTAYDPLTVARGWLPCDGRAVSTTTYAALFARIGSAFNTQKRFDGTNWTAPGAGNFRVPDMRSMALIGFHSGGDADVEHDVVGEVFGQKKFKVQRDNIEQFSATTASALSEKTGVLGANTTSGAFTTANIGADAAHTHTVAIGKVGADMIDNRPVSIVLGWVIKT